MPRKAANTRHSQLRILTSERDHLLRINAQLRLEIIYLKKHYHEHPIIQPAQKHPVEIHQPQPQMQTGQGLPKPRNSAWMEHVKSTQAKLGGSYKQAMQAASQTWRTNKN